VEKFETLYKIRSEEQFVSDSRAEESNNSRMINQLWFIINSIVAL